jgi:Fic family protein
MAYQPLSKLFYMDDSSDRFKNNEELAAARLSADASFRLGIATGAGELFLAVPHELSVLNERVLRMERKVSLSLNSLPPVARGSLIRDLVINEVVCTNELENIHSTRRQISEVLEDADDDEGESLAVKRFRELAKLYLGLSDPSVTIPQTLEDIRSVYDRVMAGEPLGKSELPDGALFRRERVEVIGRGGKMLHEGAYPEAAIEEGLTKMMQIASSGEMPQTFGAILSHYLFEYVHPFYDGNGRTGRYLLALYLSRPLSTLTTLSLSRTIAENKSRYYKSFRLAESPLNHGELTFFVIDMLQNIQEAQVEIVDRLGVSAQRLKRSSELLEALASDLELGERERELLSMLLQVALYGAFATTTIEECSNFLRLGRQQTRKYLLKLEERGLVTAERHRPLLFRLSDDAASKLEAKRDVGE